MTFCCVPRFFNVVSTSRINAVFDVDDAAVDAAAVEEEDDEEEDDDDVDDDDDDDDDDAKEEDEMVLVLSMGFIAKNKGLKASATNNTGSPLSVSRSKYNTSNNSDNDPTTASLTLPA